MSRQVEGVCRGNHDGTFTLVKWQPFRSPESLVSLRPAAMSRPGLPSAAGDPPWSPQGSMVHEAADLLRGFTCVPPQATGSMQGSCNLPSLSALIVIVSFRSNVNAGASTVNPRSRYRSTLFGLIHQSKAFIADCTWGNFNWTSEMVMQGSALSSNGVMSHS